MISAEVIRSLDSHARQILLYAAVWCNPIGLKTAQTLLNSASDSVGACMPVGKVLKRLSRTGWLVPISGFDDRLLLTQPLSLEAFALLSDEATSKGWWPNVSAQSTLPNENERDLFPELYRSRYQASPKTERRSLELLILDGIRLFAKGSGAEATDEFRRAMDGPNGPTLSRGIAACAARSLEETPAFHLTANDPLLEVLRCWLNLAFAYGRPVEPVLEELHRLMVENPQKMPLPLVRAFAACCVWAGRVEWVPKDFKETQGTFLGACKCLVKGDRKGAQALIRDDSPNRNPEDPYRDYDNLPERVLAAMMEAFAKPGKIAKTRPAAFFGGNFWASWKRTFKTNWMVHEYLEYVPALSEWARKNWEEAHEASVQFLDQARQSNGETAIEGLLIALAYHQRTGRRAEIADMADLIWTRARRFAQNGWYTVAHLYSVLLVGGYEAEKEAYFLKFLDERAFHFAERVAPQPEWLAALEALEKASQKKKRESSAAPGGEDEPTLFWCLSLAPSQTGCGNLAVTNLVPVIRYPGDADDGSDDEDLNSWDLERKSFRKLMSDRDRMIEAARYASNGYSSTIRWDELMKHLCGAKNLLRRNRKNGWSDYDVGPTYPMTLEQRPCEMTSSVGEDGGLVLSVPDWVLVAQDWTLRDLGKGRYAYVKIPEAAHKVLNVFATHGNGGKIVIPRDGLARAEKLIEGLGAVLPLAEPSPEEAENLRRVPAASGVRVRLDYAGDRLMVRAVVLPQPDNPNLTLDPAYGPVEKMVVGVAASYVLVRNLEAEKTSFEPVKQALAEFESEFDGRSVWTFDDLAMGIAALDRLKALGETVPLEWMNDRRLNVTCAPASGVKLSSRRTADDWFRVDGEFQLDDGRVMNVVTMLEAAKTRVGNYVRLSDGDYVALSKAMTRELDALNAAGRRKGSAVEIVKAAIPMLDATFGGGDDALQLPEAMAVTAKEIQAAFAKRPKAPKTLNAELRPYQDDGYRWLSRLAACGFGSCLADDMGLGKTVQIIALLLERAKDGPSVVVAPSSVCGNWRRELERFAPSLRPVMALEETLPLTEAKAMDVVISSYGYLLFHEKEFAEPVWNGLVLDEAQAIKNDASKRARTVKALRAKFRVAATGTPVENRLGELWSLFDFLNPGLLGPAASFTQRFTTADGKAVPELKRLVKPLILRRLKGDVLDDLPEKTEVTIPVVLGKEERTAYEGCRQHALAQLAQKAENGGEANRMSILAELTRLRRFCCHPSLVLPGAGVPSAKMEALVELLDGLHEGHHRALVFSQFTDYLALVRKMIEAHGWSHLYLDGSTPTLERERLVNAFQGGEGDFFLISLKAGGTGLNLTAANYVILLDPWWNPAVENQAADRAHRIGQKNPVTVYRLIASDTVEARVIELHHEKLAIAEDVLDGTSSSSLSPAQLMRLFS